MKTFRPSSSLAGVYIRERASLGCPNTFGNNAAQESRQTRNNSCMSQLGLFQSKRFDMCTHVVSRSCAKAGRCAMCRGATHATARHTHTCTPHASSPCVFLPSVTTHDSSPESSSELSVCSDSFRVFHSESSSESSDSFRVRFLQFQWNYYYSFLVYFRG